MPAGHWRKVVAVTLGLIVCVAVIEPLGFVVAVAAYLLFLLRVVEKEPWRTSLGVTVGAIAVLFGLFHAVAARAAAQRAVGVLIDGCIDPSRPGLQRAAAAQVLRLLPRRRAGRTDHRRAARHRAQRGHRDPAAADVRRRPDRLDHHVRRHLLRRAVRRHAHFGAGQHSGRVVDRDDEPGRLSDGAQGTCRRGARHGRDRLVHRRHGRHARADAARAAARGGRAVLRAARVFRAGAGRAHRAVAGRRRAGQRADDGAGRT